MIVVMKYHFVLKADTTHLNTVMQMIVTIDWRLLRTRYISFALKNTPFIARHFLRMASLQNLSIACYCCGFASSHSQKLSHSKQGILKRERYNQNRNGCKFQSKACPSISNCALIRPFALNFKETFPAS